MSTYRWELRKLVAQKRVWFGVLAAALIPAAFATGLAISPAKPPSSGGGIDPDVYLSLAYNATGLVLPFVTLVFSSLVLIPLLAALVAGDIVASEDGNNTLKTVLTRAVSRRELLVSKMAATATYVLVLLVVFAVSGTVIGTVAQGAHPLTLGGSPLGAGFSFAAPTVGVGRLLLRILLVFLFYAPPLLAVSAWGFLLSTITHNSGASIVGMLVFSFANQIIGFLPSIPDSVTRWLLTDQFTAWQAVLGTSIGYGPLWHATYVSVIYAAIPLAISLWAFQRRDVLV